MRILVVTCNVSIGYIAVIYGIQLCQASPPQAYETWIVLVELTKLCEKVYKNCIVGMLKFRGGCFKMVLYYEASKLIL